eukprot:gene19385-biopygen6115
MLRAELKSAASQNRPVVVGAARHSMGGQSLARNGAAITFAAPSCEVDRSARVFRVQAGTRWHEAIQVLDRLGGSPAVMQSNSDFAVGSTFSVNAHGWPVPYGPFGATVRAIRLMLADGTIMSCSRTENAELFGLAMGGYGLVGILGGVDFKTNRFNAMIVAVSIGVGMVPLIAPNFRQWMPHAIHPLIESGILLASITAVALNVFFNGASRDTSAAVNAARQADAH